MWLPSQLSCLVVTDSSTGVPIRPSVGPTAWREETSSPDRPPILLHTYIEENHDQVISVPNTGDRSALRYRRNYGVEALHHRARAVVAQWWRSLSMEGAVKIEKSRWFPTR